MNFFTATACVVGLAIFSCGASAAPQTPRIANAFVDSIGVNVHAHFDDTSYGKWNEIILPRLKELGIRHVRDGAIDSTSEAYFANLKALKDAGIKGTYICDFGGMRPSRLVQFVERVGNVEALEGPNEYDMRHVDDWMAILYDYQRRLYWTVKREPSLKGIPVLGPSLVQYDNYPKLAAYRPDVEAGIDETAPPISAYMDIGNLHPYPGGQMPSRNIAGEIKSVRRAWGDKPLIPTETGYHNAVKIPGGHLPTSETATGKYLPRLFAEYFNAGFTRSFAYEFIDLFPDLPGKEFVDAEHHFGLLHVDGTPKPSFIALKNLIALLNEPAPAKAFVPKTLDFEMLGATEQVHQLLVQKANGEWNLLLWQEVSSWDVEKRTDIAVTDVPIRLRFKTPLQNAQVFHPGAGVEATQNIDAPTILDLKVPDEIVVVRLVPRGKVK
jgi:hypothetical protein